MSVRSLATRLFNARTNVPWVLAMVTGAGIGGSQDMMVRGLALGLALGLTWALLFGKQPGDADRSSEA